jgi:hypothetical protein
MMKGTESSLPIQCCRNIQYSKNKESSKNYVTRKSHVLHQMPLRFCHDINFALLFFVKKQNRSRKVSVWRDITCNITYSNFCRSLC